MKAIHTPKGVEALTKQAAVEAFFESLGYQVVATPKADASRMDTLLVKDGRLVGALEIKCREMDLRKMVGYGSVILSMDKIRWMQATSKILSIPTFFVVGLSDGWIAAAQITDKAGRVVVATNERMSETQATCNGGTATRLNAYINAKDFKLRQI